MRPGLELFVGGVVVLFVLVLAAAVYYDPVAASRFRGLTGASLGSAVLAGCLGCVTVVGLAAAGRLPPALTAGRGGAYGLLFVSVPLVVGFVAVAVAYENGRTLRRLRYHRDAPPGETATGRVALTSTARPTGTVERTPLFGRDALCWEWHLDARNWGGNDDGRFHTVRAGDGGVPFVLDHERGSLRVDPTDASLELGDECVEATPPGTFPEGGDPGAFDHDWSLPGDRWRHHESVLEPGATVTVLGTVEETPDGPTVAGGDPFVVASGGVDRFRRRCHTRLQVGAFVGLAGLAGGTWLLVEAFAVPV
jgi:hypothetical protein